MTPTSDQLTIQAPEFRDPASVDDIEWAVRLLAATPTHEGRDRELLHQWARRADEFGSRLAPVPSTARVVERDDGLERMLLARYTSRPPTVELYTDTLALAEELVDARGWRAWYPPGSVRAAALAHEAVHAHLHHGPAKSALKQALDHTVLRLGRHRVAGHVAGAEEVAAHAYARTVCGLGRSPLLLTAALRAELTPPGREK
ncbi:hypothetical protein QFZ24_000984 [Streptomyces phaeochromogenes]|jgi:hypothetical protein|uniref:hypothetical protein n=1 Tax=Streptomyces phaeochromogenes TaxID=1923 RepID=UPI002792BBDD|nr:hypothetical protein [Streptomyces phaeochromogenes]MDQ0947061.1 hypothetical protein [Streptomyces phaeochromogenes]